MSTKTTNFNLTKPDLTDNADITVMGANMDLIDAEMHANANAATAAQTTANQATAAGSATDTIIGNRTADPTQVPSGPTGTLTQLLSWLTNRIKAITGTANWYDAPPTTLTTASAHIANTLNPHNVTATQVGAIPTSAEGVANGVATLDVNGKLTASQMPTQVSDVSNFATASASQGTQIAATWTNPTSNDFTGRSLFVSTSDITNSTYAYCVANATLISSGVGAGGGAADSYNDASTVGTKYYFKIFALYDIAGATEYSAGVSTNVTATDTTPPGNVSSDTATAGNGQVVIKWTDPADADWAGTKLLRKLGSYPTSQSDGTVVVTSTTRNQYSSTGYTDTGLTNGTQYYYQLFPYDGSGNYNTNVANQLTATPVAYSTYGVAWQTSPDTVTRLGNAAGQTRAFFDAKAPWSGIRRCNLSDAGVVNAYYGDAAYKDDGSNGQVMVEIPEFWYQLNVVSGGYEFWIADGPVSGFTLHPAFYRDRTNSGVASAVTKRYYSAYEGIYDGVSKLQSKSGAVPTVSQTIGTFRTYATARGNGWGITDFNLLYAVQMLYLVEYASFDSQTQIGQGFTAGTNSAATATGSTASLGNVSGNATGAGTTGTHSMTFRGIEDFYGNVYDWIDGYVTTGTSGSTPITIHIDNHGFNDTGSGYAQSYVSAANWTNASGYESDIWGDTRLGFTPKAFAGSSSTKLYDNGVLNSGCLPVFGGSWSNGANAGAFCLNVNYAASSVYSSVGARLAF